MKNKIFNNGYDMGYEEGRTHTIKLVCECVLEISKNIPESLEYMLLLVKILRERTKND